MIRFESLTIGYGDRMLVRDACAEIPDGSFTALLGRNGSGKSTLLSAICGAKRDYSGKIYTENIESEGAATTVTAHLSLGEYEASLTIPLVLVP